MADAPAAPVVSAAQAAAVDSPISRAPRRLRCEYLENPLGLDELRPRLSWELDDPRRGAMQSAYQIQVATSPQLLADNAPDIWDSAQLESEQSIQIEYAGPPLESRRTYYWRVRTWDAEGEASPWSRIQWWEMGLLESKFWKGQWIGPIVSEDDKAMAPSPYLRKKFPWKGRLRRARLYATAKGIYELHLNGRRVGQDRFAPGWTEYHHRLAYQTYDVTDLIKQGDNVIGAILGDGWYGGHVAAFQNRRIYGPAPKLLAQLELELEDGRTQTVATGEDWRITTGPILRSDFMRGEHYDARLELGNWSEAGYDDGKWKLPEAEPLDQLHLVAQAMPPVRPMHRLIAKSRTQVRPGVWIFDLGQNMVGNVRLKVTGQAGQTVTLRYGEMLNPDGSLYTDNYRTALSWDQYTLKGPRGNLYGPPSATEEIYEPHFTFKGFRYVEVSGYPAAGGEPPLTAIEGVVLYSANDPTGEFECSDPLLNQLQSNIVWGQRGNFLEVPTDCPQRDERLGWMGDAQVFVRTACFNMDVAAFFTKWMKDVELAQREDGAFPDVVPDTLVLREGVSENFGRPAWADAGIVIPWTLYLCYGDQRILERHYDAMARWIDYCRSNSEGLIRPDGGYGDWLSIDAPTPTDLLNTAWFAHSTRLMARIATVLGRDEDAAAYLGLFQEIRDAFHHRFVTPAARVCGETQTAYLLALAFDLLPEAQRPAALEQLVRNIEQRQNHLSTGFVGTPWLLPVLSENGRLDKAFTLLHQTTFPSWLFAVTHGATTIWERWDGWTPEKGFQSPGMNSFNHYAYGAVGQWIYQTIGGIDLQEKHPGYKQIIIRPRPLESGLTFARTAYHSIHGTIKTHWTLGKDHWTLAVTLPPNTRATILLPAGSMESITEGGRPIDQAPGLTLCRMEADSVRCEAGAGQYEFIIERMQTR
jgi:alpha-L-rhamnosidase